jgi:MFS family permease
MSGEDDETPNQRLARNVSELLSELRVAQAGVQILFGFLLTVVFTDEFREASGFEKGLHLAAVVLAAVSTALLTAPAAWHRMLFRTGRRWEIVRVGNRAVLAGLACLAGAITVTVALITKVVYGTVAMGIVGGVVAVMFIVLWFIIPRWLSRHR